MTTPSAFPPQPWGISQPATEEPARYTNGANVASSQWDVTIDFLLASQATGSTPENPLIQQHRVAQIVMSPMHAKAFDGPAKHGSRPVGAEIWQPARRPTTAAERTADTGQRNAEGRGMMPKTPIAYPVFVQSTGNADLPTSAGTASSYQTTGSTGATSGSAGTISSAPTQVTLGQVRPSDSEPELAWLTSAEAAPYKGHWVALRAGTGTFLGLADSTEDLLRWRSQDVSILFVVPRGEWIGG